MRVSAIGAAWWAATLMAYIYVWAAVTGQYDVPVILNRYGEFWPELVWALMAFGLVSAELTLTVIEATRKGRGKDELG